MSFRELLNLPALDAARPSLINQLLACARQTAGKAPALASQAGQLRDSKNIQALTEIVVQGCLILKDLATMKSVFNAEQSAFHTAVDQLHAQTDANVKGLFHQWCERARALLQPSSSSSDSLQVLVSLSLSPQGVLHVAFPEHLSALSRGAKRLSDVRLGPERDVVCYNSHTWMCMHIFHLGCHPRAAAQLRPVCAPAPTNR